MCDWPSAGVLCKCVKTHTRTISFTTSLLPTPPPSYLNVYPSLYPYFNPPSAYMCPCICNAQYLSLISLYSLPHSSLFFPASPYPFDPTLQLKRICSALHRSLLSPTSLTIVPAWYTPKSVSYTLVLDIPTFKKKLPIL